MDLCCGSAIGLHTSPRDTKLAEHYSGLPSGKYSVKFSVNILLLLHVVSLKFCHCMAL